MKVELFFDLLFLLYGVIVIGNDISMWMRYMNFYVYYSVIYYSKYFVIWYSVKKMNM